jgi:hypothetical protein
MISEKLSRTLSPSLLYKLNLNYLHSNYFLHSDTDNPIKHRYTSNVSTFSAKLNITKQYSPHIKFKTILEYIYHNYNISSEYNDAVETKVMAIGSISNLIFEDNINYKSPYKLREAWKAYPQHGAAYFQEKFSYNQMIMNLGLRPH